MSEIIKNTNNFNNIPINNKIDEIETRFEEIESVAEENFETCVELMSNIKDDVKLALKVKNKEINRLKNENKELKKVIKRFSTIIENLKYFVSLVCMRIMNFYPNHNRNYFESYPQLTNDEFWLQPDDFVFKVSDDLSKILERKEIDDNLNKKRILKLENKCKILSLLLIITSSVIALYFISEIVKVFI